MLVTTSVFSSGMKDLNQTLVLLQEYHYVQEGHGLY